MSFHKDFNITERMDQAKHIEALNDLRIKLLIKSDNKSDRQLDAWVWDHHVRPESIRPTWIMINDYVHVKVTSKPYFIHETGRFIHFDDLYDPSYTPYFAIETDSCPLTPIVTLNFNDEPSLKFYMYSPTKDIMKVAHFRYSSMLLTVTDVDPGKYDNLIIWINKNLPLKNSV